MAKRRTSTLGDIVLTTPTRTRALDRSVLAATGVAQHRGPLPAGVVGLAAAQRRARSIPLTTFTVGFDAPRVPQRGPRPGGTVRYTRGRRFRR